MNRRRSIGRRRSECETTYTPYSEDTSCPQHTRSTLLKLHVTGTRNLNNLGSNSVASALLFCESPIAIKEKIQYRFAGYAINIRIYIRTIRRRPDNVPNILFAFGFRCRTSRKKPTTSVVWRMSSPWVLVRQIASKRATNGTMNRPSVSVAAIVDDISNLPTADAVRSLRKRD